MKKLYFIGWKEGFNKVAFTKLLVEQSPLGLKNAKEITDRILEGQEAFILLEDTIIAKFVVQAEKLGVKCKI